MPATNTITAFYTFVARTRARANQVNTNFEAIRGNFIPINTDTATASHQVHNLGSVDHQWKQIHLTEAPYINGNQVGKREIEVWHDGSNPCDIIDDEDWLAKTAFRFDDTTGVAFNFVVPDEYVIGNRISLSLRGYCETATSHFAMELGSALYKASITSLALTAPANVFTSTSNIQPAVANLLFTNTSLRLTSADGKINGVTVTAGDVIACYLNRTGNAVGDTNTGNFFLTNLLLDLNN